MVLNWYLQAICTLNYKNQLNATEMILFRKKIDPYIHGLTALRYHKHTRHIDLYHNNFITRLSLNHNNVKTRIRKMSV